MNTKSQIMEDDFTVFRSQRICRTCLIDNTENLAKNHIDLHESETLKRFVEKISDIKIDKGDGLPEFICCNCTIEVENALKFAEKCRKYDEQLRNQIKIGKVHINNIEFVEEISINDAYDDCLKLESDSDGCTKHFLLDQFTLKKIKPQLSGQQCSEIIEFGSHVKTDDFKDQIKCDSCALYFQSSEQLKSHSCNCQTEKEKYFCSKCDKKFGNGNLYDDHILQHKIKEIFSCSKCSKVFKTKAGIVHHEKLHDRYSQKEQFICHICAKVFGYPSLLKQHIVCHTGYKPHKCPECSKTFGHIGALNHHRKIHSGEKRFTCDICKEKFISQSVLRVHARKHTNEKPYICDECGVGFRQISDLKRHGRTHTGERTVLCTVCGKNLTTTGQLTIHLRTHTGEKPFKCETCGKAFTSKTMLVKHIRIHTNERPYVCHKCGKAFRQNSTLKTHFKTHQDEKNISKNKQSITDISDVF